MPNINRAYQFRLYPTAAQAELIQKTFGCVRYVYNHYLAQRRDAYNETGKAPTRFQQDKGTMQKYSDKSGRMW